MAQGPGTKTYEITLEVTVDEQSWEPADWNWPNMLEVNENEIKLVEVKKL